MLKTQNQIDRKIKFIIQCAMDGCIPDNSDEDTDLVIHECVARGYITGINSLLTESGRYRSIVHTNVQVTKDGLDFLHPKKDWKFIVPTIIAIAELLVIILQAIQSVRG